MKKIIVTFFTVISSCLLYSQSFDYEWSEVTSKFMRIEPVLTAYTKGGGVVVATKEGWLAASVDTGKNWTMTYDVVDVTEDLFTKEADFIYNPTVLNFASDSLHGLFAVTYKKENKFKNVFLYTIDGGLTWSSPASDIDGMVLNVYWTTKSVFAVILTDDNTLSLYASNDYGVYWEKRYESISSTSFTNDSNVFIAFVNDLLGYVFSDGSYSITQDGGLTWEIKNIDIRPAFLFQFNNGQILLVVRNHINTNLIGCRVINMYDRKVGISEYYNIPKSMYDLGNGKIWASVSGGYNINNNKISSTDSLKTWVFTQETYIPPINKLNEFMSQYIYNGNMTSKLLYVKSANEIFVIGTQNGRLYQSKTGGKSWDYKDFKCTLSQMQFISDDIIYMLSTDSLFISSDGGDSWVGMKLPDVKGLRMHFFTKDFGYVYDDTYIYMTKDAGKSWSELYNKNLMEFIQNGGTFNGCFANERLGLFKNDDSKVFLSAKVDIENESVTISAISNKIEGTGRSNILINYVDGRWILKDIIVGNIYICDTSYSFQKVAEREDYGMGNIMTTSLLDYGNGILVQPVLGETAGKNDTARISLDYGETWNAEYFPSPRASLLEKSDNPNVIYACETKRYLHVYKGVHKIKNADFSFEKQENGTIKCSISNAENQTYTAKVLVEQVNGTTIVVQDNVEIKSGESFVVTLPQNITANYVLKVIPEDEDVYETVLSQEFIVNNGGSAIDAVSSDDIQIRVVNGKIECNCDDYAIYNVAGQKVQTNASLPSGTYFVHCGTQVKKVVVK